MSPAQPQRSPSEHSLSIANQGTCRPSRHTLGSEYLGEASPDESLGKNHMAAQIADDVVATRPSVIGIFGRWGVGKTHLLNHLGQLLAARHKVCCFRAWEYEAEGDLASAMIRSLVTIPSYPFNSMPQAAGPPFFPAKDIAIGLAWGLGNLALDLATALLPSGGKAARKALDLLLEARVKEQDTPRVPTVDQIRARMAELIAAITGDNEHLFVLIDDLDRCAPPNVIRLFEWFKNHLDTPRCTYILGLDQRMAAKAVMGQYKAYVGQDDDYGYHYLHKLLERDYEIQPSPQAQAIAMKRLSMEGGDIVQWTSATLRRSFAGGPEMTKLLAVPDLWVPRLMIRLLDTYRLSIEALRRQDRAEHSLLSNDLDATIPFWLLLLSMVHHLLTPDRVEPFVARVGNTPREEQKNLGTVLLGDLGPSAQRAELAVELNRVQLAWLQSHQIDYLYRIVREKTPRSLRNAD